MKRIPEPELMDEPEQARAYARADFSEPHNRFVELFSECFPELPDEGFVLDLGCGPGDIACRFAKRFPQFQVHGVDAASAMLGEAPELIQKHGVGSRVRLFHGYLPEARLPRDSYSIVISNSLLHHLADAAVLWQSVRRFGEPGSRVFIMDLMRPESEERARELTEIHAAGEPAVLQRDFLHSLRAAYTVAEVGRQLEAHDLRSFRVRPVSDRHWIAHGMLEEV